MFLKDDTEDPDDNVDSEHFDTRQSFLNLCQGNHYQFDQLRRAKHTSMMVLYHLHNPDAPKFVPSCQNCKRDILTGHRLRCEACEVDICPECYNHHGPGIHHHPLRAMSVGGPVRQMTEEERKNRAKAIELHLTLLVHASACTLGKDCKSRHCQKMKEILMHVQLCKIQAKNGCPICKRIQNLIPLHARNCRLERCSVPGCREIKEHLRQNAMRQQNMDDARRSMMNEMYGRRPVIGAGGSLQPQPVDGSGGGSSSSGGGDGVSGNA